MSRLSRDLHPHEGADPAVLPPLHERLRLAPTSVLLLQVPDLPVLLLDAEHQAGTGPVPGHLVQSIDLLLVLNRPPPPPVNKQ